MTPEQQKIIDGMELRDVPFFRCARHEMILLDGYFTIAQLETIIALYKKLNQ